MSRSWFLVIFIYVIVSEAKKNELVIEPNLDVVQGLICYQCRSITSEQTPLCDKSLFKLTTRQEKLNMSLQCPHYQGAFCFTKTTYLEKHTETLRGCSGSTDIKDNLLKVGCMTKKNQVICLCDTRFCNKVLPNCTGFGSSVFLGVFFNVLSYKTCFSFF